MAAKIVSSEQDSRYKEAQLAQKWCVPRALSPESLALGTVGALSRTTSTDTNTHS